MDPLAWTWGLQVLGVLALLPAAAADRDRQRVPRELWYAPLLLGLITTGLLVSSWSVAVIGRVLVSVVVVGGFGLALAYVGLWGGADGFMAAAVALLYPVGGTLTLPITGWVLPVYSPPAGLLWVAVVINLAVIAPAYYGLRRLHGATTGSGGSVPYVVAVWWAVMLAVTLGPVTGLLG